MNQDELDIHFMRMALNEARMAFDADEVPIGAVVVCGNRVIGRGHNLTETLNDVTAHAEMQALAAAPDVCRSHRMEPDKAHRLRSFRPETGLYHLYAEVAFPSQVHRDIGNLRRGVCHSYAQFLYKKTLTIRKLFIFLHKLNIFSILLTATT